MNVKQKILITGANGMLGYDLCPVLKSKGFDIYPTDKNTGDDIQFMDICDFERVKGVCCEVKPDIIFHLAAETDVDLCEKEIEYAYLTNTIGTQNIALLCQEYDIPMIYISTCGVFDGNKSSIYTEYDEPNPVSVYSKTKLEGEKIVQSLLKRFFIFRAGWMIGGVEKDKKFVAKIVGLLKTKKELIVVNDKFGSPTFTKDFALCIVEVVLAKRYGLYHVTNKGGCSRYEIACKIAKIIGKEDVHIKPVSSAFFPLPAPRPNSEMAENFNLKLIGMDVMCSWEDRLEKYLMEMIKEEK